MEKKSKIFLAVFLGLIILAVGASFYRYFIAKDYYITAEAFCDPAAEKCFIYECDPQSEECPEDPAEGKSYYKIIKKKAYAIPLCDPNDENCPALACAPGEDCQETFCDEETAEEEMECSDPEVYRAELAAEEEAEASLETEGQNEEESEEDISGDEEEGGGLEIETGEVDPAE